MITNLSNVLLKETPDKQSENVDEMLYGWECEIVETLGEWVKVHTFYGYEGYCEKAELIEAEWEATHFVMRSWIDVLSEPKVQGRILKEIPRGGKIAVLGHEKDGWSRVLLADGQTGYTKTGFLRPIDDHPLPSDEEAFRQSVVDTAKLYLGTQYRWAGENSNGIDCSGLTHMAYLLNGVIIHRDASIKEPFPIKEISFDRKRPGDLMFFPGHVVMYIGEDLYIHSTAFAGSDGVVINSMDPKSPIYRPDLMDKLKYVGSLF